MGSLRSLVHNPLAQKNQPRKIKRSWRGLLARNLRKKIAVNYPYLHVEVDPHYIPYKYVGIKWILPDMSYRNYEGVEEFILETIMSFAARRGLNLKVSHTEKTAWVVTREGE
jgi:hypothetical protein